MRQVLSAALASLALLSGFGGAHAAEPRVVPAVDGIFAAFKDHPVVGLGDAHGLAEEGDFYEQLVADPRFAKEVGNVVFEAASAFHQTTLDRYLAGEDVPRAEVRRIWSEAIGWGSPPTEMYGRFLAAVRETNRKLPPRRRIKVWAGEPPADWNTIHSADDLEPYLQQRDSYPAGLIRREILAKGKKALVIYGALHFYPLPTIPPYPPGVSIKGLVEAARPGAVFVVHPYSGYLQPDCSTSFEAATRWPAGSLVTPVRSTSLEALLTRPDCPAIRPPRPVPGGPQPSPEALARAQAGHVRAASGIDADAILYLGPAASLTRSPDDPDLTRDPAYAQEIRQRLLTMGDSADVLNHLLTRRVPYRPRPAAPRSAKSTP